MRKLNNRGDTIVEVMIVLAILGMAISICLATANKSLLNTRQAQENAQATELVRSQIETLRVLSCSNITTTSCTPKVGLDSSTPYCLVGDGNILVASQDYTPKPITDEGCTQGAAQIQLAIQYVASAPSAPSKFIVSATWDNAQGQDEKDSVVMTYRMPLTP